jgi:hypothetical protein
LTPFWFHQVEHWGKTARRSTLFHLQSGATMGLNSSGAGAGVAAALSLLAGPAHAVSLDQACAMFASKLDTAVQAGDQAKAQLIFQDGTQRIAQRFNGATCPTVKPPAGN